MAGSTTSWLAWHYAKSDAFVLVILCKAGEAGETRSSSLRWTVKVIFKRNMVLIIFSLFANPAQLDVRWLR
jgi:hypothetical protein